MILSLRKIPLQLNLIIFENTKLIFTLIKTIYFNLELEESLEMVYLVQNLYLTENALVLREESDLTEASSSTCLKARVRILLFDFRSHSLLV